MNYESSFEDTGCVEEINFAQCEMMKIDSADGLDKFEPKFLPSSVDKTKRVLLFRRNLCCKGR